MVYQMGGRLRAWPGRKLPAARALRCASGTDAPGPSGTDAPGPSGAGASGGMGVRVKPASFAYRRAGSVPEAVDLLGELGDEAKILAGGLSLVPMMNFRLARPSALV